jgi:DNA polymerase-3 subunit delta'
MPFRDIVGHRDLLDLLAAATARGSVPPSLIFAGPAGVGKRMAAVALAQALNCPTFSTASRDACGTCPSCTRIARLVHADVMVVEPGDTGAIKVDQVRDVVERTAYRPFEGRRRVIIIDEADAMVSEAQNALLKTLEEPPSASMFVLVTSRADELLPTVRSRCQRLRFGPLPESEIAAVLIKAHEYEPADAHAAAAAADGSLGLALDGSSEDLVAAREAAADVLRDVAGTSDPRRRLDSAKMLAGSGDRDDLRRRLRAIASMLRDVGVIDANVGGQYLANADLEAMLQRLAGSFDRARISRAFAAVDRGLEAIDRNASPKIVADWVALQL